MHFPEIRVHCEDDGESRQPLSARWLFVFNLPCYGGGFRIAPHADGSDGLLDVCSFRRGHFWPGWDMWPPLLLRRHQRLADWTTRRVRRLRITSDAPGALPTRRRPRRVAAAGDRVAARPVDVGCARGSGRGREERGEGSGGERIAESTLVAFIIQHSYFIISLPCPKTPSPSEIFAAAAASRCWSLPGRA